MPIDSVNDLVGLLNATDPHRVKGSFQNTQAMIDYPLLRAFNGGLISKSAGGGTSIQERIRLRKNTGATRTTKLYDVTSAQKSPPVDKMTVQWALYENKGEVYDLREMAMNQSSAEQIVDLMDTEEQANLEDMAETFEYDFYTPYVSSTDQSKFNGIWGLLRGSFDSNGAAVANPTGGFNGVRTRFQDGTTSTTFQGLDASLVENERLRNWVATRSSTTMDLATVKLLSRGMRMSNFRPNPIGGGLKTAAQPKIFMSQNDHDAYRELIALGPDDKNRGGKGDYFTYANNTIDGIEIERTPVMDSDTLYPIFFLRPDQIKLYTLAGFWLKRGKAREIPNSHNSAYIPNDSIGQTFNRNPRQSGGVIHYAA